MADDQSETTATGSEEEAMALMCELRLTPLAGVVGVGAAEWIVIIYERCKRPALTHWLGWPVKYRIGGGMPRAN